METMYTTLLIEYSFKIRIWRRNIFRVFVTERWRKPSWTILRHYPRHSGKLWNTSNKITILPAGIRIRGFWNAKQECQPLHDESGCNFWSEMENGIVNWGPTLETVIDMVVAAMWCCLHNSRIIRGMWPSHVLLKWVSGQKLGRGTTYMRSKNKSC